MTARHFLKLLCLTPFLRLVKPAKAAEVQHPLYYKIFNNWGEMRKYLLLKEGEECRVRFVRRRYTGKEGYQPAGIVHKGEYIMPPKKK